MQKSKVHPIDKIKGHGVVVEVEHYRYYGDLLQTRQQALDAAGYKATTEITGSREERAKLRKQERSERPQLWKFLRAKGGVTVVTITSAGGISWIGRSTALRDSPFRKRHNLHRACGLALQKMLKGMAEAASKEVEPVQSDVAVSSTTAQRLETVFAG